MIIWINGAFGAGKTTAAKRLAGRVEGAGLFDPEEIGFLLRRVTPGSKQPDFQDEPLWRQWTFDAIDEIAGRQQVTVVPMTLTNTQYFDEIVGRLREKGHEVHHVTLMTSKKTIRRRLLKRLEGRKSWAYQQAEQRLAALAAERFAFHLKTDDMSKEEVVQALALRFGLLLSDKRQGRMRIPFLKR